MFDFLGSERQEQMGSWKCRSTAAESPKKVVDTRTHTYMQACGCSPTEMRRNAFSGVKKNVHGNQKHVMCVCAFRLECGKVTGAELLTPGNGFRKRLHMQSVEGPQHQSRLHLAVQLPMLLTETQPS